MDPKPKRVRNANPKISLAEFIRKHSPMKNGLRIPNENKPLEKYSKITDKIYLGNYQAAKDKDLFSTKKIKAVLNCTRDIPHYFIRDKDIEYMRIAVEDSLKDKDFDLMYQYMPCIVEFIHKHVYIQKHNILVHCHAGRQRSAIAVAAYLVAKYNMTPHEACKLILEKRSEAFHYGKSLNFDQALKKYAKQIAK
jgi:protein-tyrosine phosphatase